MDVPLSLHWARVYPRSVYAIHQTKKLERRVLIKRHDCYHRMFRSSSAWIARRRLASTSCGGLFSQRIEKCIFCVSSVLSSESFLMCVILQFSLNLQSGRCVERLSNFRFFDKTPPSNVLVWYWLRLEPHFFLHRKSVVDTSVSRKNQCQECQEL